MFFGGLTLRVSSIIMYFYFYFLLLLSICIHQKYKLSLNMTMLLIHAYRVSVYCVLRWCLRCCTRSVLSTHAQPRCGVSDGSTHARQLIACLKASSSVSTIDRARLGFAFLLLFSLSKWCGNAQGQEQPLSERFMEFVGHTFRNRAYQALSRSIICIRGFQFCKPEHEVICLFHFSSRFFSVVRVHVWSGGARLRVAS